MVVEMVYVMCKVGQPAQISCGTESAPQVGFDNLRATHMLLPMLHMKQCCWQVCPKERVSAGILRFGGWGVSHPVYEYRRMRTQVEPQQLSCFIEASNSCTQDGFLQISPVIEAQD